MAEIEVQTTDGSGLFSDLKERRFFPFLFSYILGAFTIVQLAEWVIQRYTYSPYWTDAIFLFFVLLLPSVVMFIYHHGKPGPDSWKPMEKWFIPLNIVIAIAAVGFGLKGKDFGKTQESVVVVDEEGQRIARMVPNSAYSQKLTIFPSELPDGGEDWLRIGFGILLERDLEQDAGIYPRSPTSSQDKAVDLGLSAKGDLSFAQKRELAKEQYSSYFITSKITESGEKYKVDVSAYTTADGKEFFSESYTDMGLYEVADLVVLKFREQLIDDRSIVADKSNLDLPASELISSNPEAFKLYMQSLYAATYDNDFEKATLLAEEASEVDNQSAMIWNHLGGLYIASNRGPDKERVMEKALSLSEGLPERQILAVKKNYYLPQQFNKLLGLLDYHSKLFPNDYSTFAELASYHRMLGANKKAIEVSEQALEHGHRGTNLLTLSRLYDAEGESAKALNYFEQFSEEFPERAAELNDKGKLLLGLGKFQEAKTYFEQKMLGEPNNTGIISSLADASGKLLDFDKQEKYLLQNLGKAKAYRIVFHIILVS